MKPNNTPIYINSKSNHPPSIIKNIPAAVNRRLNSIDNVFKEAITQYQDALDRSGYEHQLKYDPPSGTINGNCKRSRKITWFNPPFSQNVSTNVGAKFLELIDSCFPPSHPLSKIINRNKVKVSYRCMPNMGQIIARHNSKVAIQGQGQQPPPGCNCKRGPATCPVNGVCLTEGVVYQATVTRGDNKKEETYTGLTSRSFKDRLYEHHSDFNNQNRDATCLSKHMTHDT